MSTETQEVTVRFETDEADEVAEEVRAAVEETLSGQKADGFVRDTTD
ncbi:MAG: hypothetical protein ACI9QA_000429, partial [Methanobacteriota archaeon]